MVGTYKIENDYNTIDFSGLRMAPDPTATQGAVDGILSGNLSPSGSGDTIVLTVNDSLDNKYTLDLSFTKTGTNTWTLSAADVANPTADPRYSTTFVWRIGCADQRVARSLHSRGR